MVKPPAAPVTEHAHCGHANGTRQYRVPGRITPAAAHDRANNWYRLWQPHEDRIKGKPLPAGTG
jgi:hypothetical protein